MKSFFFVFLGGGLGSVCRYMLSLYLTSNKDNALGFPWATFTANISGCLLIGLFYALSTRLNLSYETRLFLTVGLCGGYTTFSTFSNESFILLKEGALGTLALYILGSVVLGIIAVWIGVYGGSRM